MRCRKSERYFLTFLSLSAAAKARLRSAVMVLFPTPPFPDSTIILFCTCSKRSLTYCMLASGPFASPDAQSCWLGHPAQAEALPASSLSVPGQSGCYKILCEHAERMLNYLRWGAFAGLFDVSLIFWRKCWTNSCFHYYKCLTLSKRLVNCVLNLNLLFHKRKISQRSLSRYC